MLNHSNHFLNSAKNLTAGVDPDKDVFTDKEIESLEKIIQETEEWADKTIKSQNKLKKYEPVVLTVKSITDKMGILDREVKYLVNKLRLWKPKKEETTDKPKKSEKKGKKKEDVKDEVKLESDSETNETVTIKDEERTENVSESEKQEANEDKDPPHNEL
ncbi:hypothetical protein HHI36_009622 [Cryptolaemus montrouzieri]|uniref:Uncharacterized protein n=1 Tax=Cryptolaemus montrouzieri TaxID=559131 RepID=A0ABD2MGC9_9CUCU